MGMKKTIILLVLILFSGMAYAQDEDNAPKITSFTGEPKSGRIVLYWSAEGDTPLRFTVSKKMYETDNYAEISDAKNIAYTSYTDSTVAKGKIYYYKVEATNEHGIDYSEVAVASSVAVCGDNELEFGEECEKISDCNKEAASCDLDKRGYGTRIVECSSCKCVVGEWSLDKEEGYCSNCAHCGDGVENCGETVYDCPADVILEEVVESPEDVNAEITEKGIIISWTDSKTVPFGYNVYKENELIGSTSDNNFLDKDFEEGKTYSYAVRGVSGKGVESKDSVTTQISVPEKNTCKKDGHCNSWCGRTEDLDCICNYDRVCEQGIENAENCPDDCVQKIKIDESILGVITGVILVVLVGVIIFIKLKGLQR
ncbi:MAG: hypothetical protein ABIE23_02100 [archaeon]